MPNCKELPNQLIKQHRLCRQQNGNIHDVVSMYSIPETTEYLTMHGRESQYIHEVIPKTWPCPKIK